jgi:hypothetical protein
MCHLYITILLLSLLVSCVYLLTSSLFLVNFSTIFEYMFVSRTGGHLIKSCYFRYDQLSNMAARGHTSLWLAEICYDLLRYYMEDGIENCHEWSLQSVNQVLLLFGPIESPRWPPVRDTNMYSNIVLKLTRKREEVNKYIFNLFLAAVTLTTMTPKTLGCFLTFYVTI